MFGFRREMSSENLAFFLVLDFVGGGLSGFRARDMSFSVFWFFILSAYRRVPRQSSLTFVLCQKKLIGYT